MNRLTEKIVLVLISSSLVLSGCGQNEGEVAEGGDTTWGKDSARGSGSQSGGYFSRSYSPWYFFGSPSYGNGGGHTGGGFFSGFSGSHGGSSRGGFGASAHGAGS